MPTANINGINLNYEIRGKGPKMLFIHGIGAGIKNPYCLFNSPLADQFTLLAFDPRGIGDSDFPDKPYSMADLADDAAGLAKDAGWDKYHVFGASMGGMIAQELALKYPAAVDKLVLAVTNAGGKKHPVPQVIDKLFTMTAAEKLALSDSRQNQAWADAHPEAVSMMEAQTQAMRKSFEENPALMKGFEYQVNAVLKHDTFDRLKEIKAPAFVFAGRYDLSNPAAAVRAMAGEIQGARFEIVEYGHGNWFSDAALWSNIAKFLLNK